MLRVFRMGELFRGTPTDGALGIEVEFDKLSAKGFEPAGHLVSIGEGHEGKKVASTAGAQQFGARRPAPKGFLVHLVNSRVGDLAGHEFLLPPNIV